MVDVSIVTKTSQKANWKGQDHVLSQADALTKSLVKSKLNYRLRIIRKESRRIL